MNFSWPLSKSEPWKSYSTSGWKFSPYKIVGDWSEPKFGDYKFPKFDLDQWNENTWDKYRVLFTECQRNGVVLFLRIGDYCSIKRPFYKRHYPYNDGSNIQNYTGGNWGEPIRKWYKKFNEKLMETITESGLEHFFIVPMNEADVIGNDSDEWKDTACREFHEFYINDFMSKGVKKEQIILNIHRPNVADHFTDLGYRMEWHWIQSPETLRDRFNLSGTHIWPNGDGKGGGEGIASYNGNREPSRKQGVEMGKQLKDKIGYCYFMRSTEPAIENVSVKYADFTALDGLIDKKLSVEGSQILYGGKSIILIGASCRLALWKGNPDYPDYDPWPDGYSLEKYEQEIIDSGINYVRHLGTLDTEFLIAHCQRMKEHGIIVEVEVYDPELSPLSLVEINRMGKLALLGNVLFNVGNEFRDNKSAIDIVIDLCERLKAQGCIVGAGAWGWSVHGKDYAQEFHDKYSGHHYETTHRNWDLASWNEALSYNKPVLWNEFFNRGELTLDDIETYVNQATQSGVHVQYYAFLSGSEPLDFKDILNIAGTLADSLNP